MTNLSEPQLLTTPSGDELVVLAKHDYDALMAALREAEEDLADLETLERRRAEMAADPNSILPADVSAQLLAGRNRLGAIRHWRQVSIADLASKSGLDAALIEAHEARASTLDVQAARQLARALEVPDDWLEP